MFKTIKKLETMECFLFVAVITVELAFFLLPAVPTSKQSVKLNLLSKSSYKVILSGKRSE